MSTRTFLNVDESVSSAQPGYITGTRVTNSSARLGLDIAMIDGLLREHTRCHQGRMYTFGKILGLSNGGVIEILFDLTTSAIHASFHGTCLNNATFEILEGVTVAGNGTVITPANNNRSSANVFNGKIYHTPTSATGTSIWSELIIGGAGVFAAGGSSSNLPKGGTEWILAPSNKYLLRLTNLVASSTTADLSATFYVNS